MLAFPTVNTVLYTKELNNILHTTMLSYLVTYKSSVTSSWIETIANIKCQLHFLYLMESLIQE